MTTQQKKAALFVKNWTNRGDEKQETAKFWIELLGEILNINNPASYIEFEKKVKLAHTSYIDAYIPETKVLIEQKSVVVDLQKPAIQSDGSMLTPFQQAKRYADEMPYDLRPRWIVICNFAEIHIHDMNHPTVEPQVILMENLEKEYYRLQFLVDHEKEIIRREMEISIKAGEIVGKLYDEIHTQYHDPQDEHALKSLNMLCVRLVFCLYAEDADIFGYHTQFHDFIQHFAVSDVRRALIDLFKVLDTKIEDRDPYLGKILADFPYVNGGLFSDETIEIPQFNQKIVDLLLHQASEDFNWSEISPTIFGAVFESTLNPDTRRKGGMHYTSIENIHKVIDPLFMNDLQEEFDKILRISVTKTRTMELSKFQNKIAGLKFLDPACGSGNFLTETYLSLRRLENKILSELQQGQVALGLDDVIKVSIKQFYGVEINDFAVTVAKTALWIAESQMMKETEDIVSMELDFLPLKSYANIVEGNALRMDWRYLSLPKEKTTIIAKQTNLFYPSQKNSVVVANEPVFHYNEIDVYTENLKIEPEREELQPVHYDYIMGNPPFVGARLMSVSQKNDVLNIFGEKWKNIGNLDYVGCWYKKAIDFIEGTDTRCTFVSTNSICQGEQVANLWKPLFNKDIHIDFAYRTFRWDSESESKAHVHCVIVGFSANNKKCESHEKTIFDGDKIIKAKNINGYLVDAANVFVESRSNPICEVPKMDFGNVALDSGHLIFTPDEKDYFIQKEPKSEQYFKVLLGAIELLYSKTRYCLWLVNCSPAELRSMKNVIERIKLVKEARLKAKDKGANKLAERPHQFRDIKNPISYLAVPVTTGESRIYIPMSFYDNHCIPAVTLQTIPNATLYHFGVLTSKVHMAWMRAVCGRLKSDYRYSKDIVYNNFPWTTPTDSQKSKIEQTAQSIFDARALYPDSSLADLYDETTMPPELRRAHEGNDQAVMSAYGFDQNMTESEIVAELFKMYEKLKAES
jgi:hypothetical protein